MQCRLKCQRAQIERARRGRGCQIGFQITTRQAASWLAGQAQVSNACYVAIEHMTAALTDFMTEASRSAFRL